MRLHLLRAWQGRYTQSPAETILRLIPVGIYTWAIFALSSRKASEFPEIVIDDRIAHFVEYAVLGGLLMFALAGARSLENRPMTRAAVSTLIAVSLGMLDEWNQSFVPGRDSSWNDVAFDLFGASFASMSVAILLRNAAARLNDGARATGSATS